MTFLLQNFLLLLYFHFSCFQSKSLQLNGAVMRRTNYKVHTLNPANTINIEPLELADWSRQCG